MEGPAVCARAPVEAAADLLPAPAFSQHAVATLLAAIQLLDEWHAPLCPDRSGEQKVAGDSHVDADLRLISAGRFNGNGELGSLIPRLGGHWRDSSDDDIRDAIMREYDGTGPGEGVGRHLRHTVLLPNRIEASLDGDAGPKRDVAVSYLRLAEADIAPRRNGPHRVVVAPLLERDEDVSMQTTPAGEYLVTPVDLVARVRSIVAAAYRQEASIVVMPEMVLSPATFAALRTELAARHAAYAEENDALPPLAYLLVGTCEPKEGGSARSNFVAVIAADGQVLARQDKVSRWNMCEDEQRQYALAPGGASAPAVLNEAIDPAAEIVVMDLPGLGRLVVLICADMDISEPGNWLYANTGLEWIYAPIMDRTRAPHRVRGDVGPWIVRRAHRAACAARARVIVANSMALTPKVNATNAARGLSGLYPAAGECHIALLLDGTSEDVTCDEVVVGLDASDVAEMRAWGDDWNAFLKA